ncbi:MAG: DUF2516 family protein [Actinomycetales bacterium]|nr:DUF2516 family protein [Actinomycetales bacterium]
MSRGRRRALRPALHYREWVFSTLQDFVFLALWLVTLVIKGAAFIDCLRRPAAAFPAIGRQTKVLWLILTGLAAGTGIFPSLALNLIGIAGVVVALIYLFDLRPKIIDITSSRW